MACKAWYRWVSSVSIANRSSSATSCSDRWASSALYDCDFAWKRQGQYHKSREVVQDRLEDRAEPNNKGYDADFVMVDFGSDFTNLTGVFFNSYNNLLSLFYSL
jgi:hypothetical protein